MTEPSYLTHDLLTLPGITHGFFTRHGGVSSGDYDSLNGGIGSKDGKEDVATNRARAAAALGASKSDIRGLYQIHSADALLANDDPRPEGDGLVTGVPGLCLTILTADCAPVLLADPEAGIIAGCHAGWRGAVAGIIASTVAAMERLGSARHRIKAVVGPTIAQASYQVGEDLKDDVLKASPWASSCFIADASAGKFRFDLPGYALAQLQRLEIESSAMAIDTYSDDRFFSHRQACHQGKADTGRLMSMIRLTP